MQLSATNQFLHGKLRVLKANLPTPNTRAAGSYQTRAFCVRSLRMEYI